MLHLLCLYKKKQRKKDVCIGSKVALICNFRVIDDFVMFHTRILGSGTQ